jgi:hypothetical protein
MTTNFGLDMSSAEDIDETRTVTGVELVAQDTFWRLQTPRGAGILEADAPNYGIDLLGIIGSVDTEADAASLPGRIQAQLTDDDRILTATVDVVRIVDGPRVEYDISIRCETAEGPFELVGKVDDEQLNLAIKLLPGGI